MKIEFLLISFIFIFIDILREIDRYRWVENICICICIQKMRQTLRVNWSIKIEAFHLLKRAAKNISMSELVSELILQKLQDPIKSLQEEKRQLLIKANEIDDKIEYLEKIKDEK